jgi:hypothetical protein
MREEESDYRSMDITCEAIRRYQENRIRHTLPSLTVPWSWEAWEATFAHADPLKAVRPREEIAALVQSAFALGFSVYQIHLMLEIPMEVIRELLDLKIPKDDVRVRMRANFVEVFFKVMGEMTRNGFVYLDPKDPRVDQYAKDVDDTVTALMGIPEVCSPEEGQRQRDWLERRNREAEAVDRYLEILVLRLTSSEPQDNAVAADTSMGAVTAVLSEMGLATLPDQPATDPASPGHLRRLIEERLAAAPALALTLDPAPTRGEVDLPSLDAIFVARPPPSSKPSAGAASGTIQIDRAARDEAHTELGKAGEKYVVMVESLRLREEGREDLAKKVRWTAQKDGDGAGYDVESFNADGSPRLIEVKTTTGDIRTPFYLTINELRVSSENAHAYWLYRVFDFRKSGAIYLIQGDLRNCGLDLQPTAYRASL